MVISVPNGLESRCRRWRIRSAAGGSAGRGMPRSASRGLAQCVAGAEERDGVVAAVRLQCAGAYGTGWQRVPDQGEFMQTGGGDGDVAGGAQGVDAGAAGDTAQRVGCAGHGLEAGGDGDQRDAAGRGGEEPGARASARVSPVPACTIPASGCGGGALTVGRADGVPALHGRARAPPRRAPVAGTRERRAARGVQEPPRGLRTTVEPAALPGAAAAVPQVSRHLG